jgi:hypothetical protein
MQINQIRGGVTTTLSVLCTPAGQGCIAEMYTGEGKTLVATLPAYLNGLTGGCTLNSALSSRDATRLYRYVNPETAMDVWVCSNAQLSAPRHGTSVFLGTNSTVVVCVRLPHSPSH